MTRKSKSGALYPDNWPEIARRLKDAVGWKCVRCLVAHDPPVAILTIHHADMDPSNSAWWNLLPLCAACHLSIQGRVDLERPWVMLPHSEWFKPYVAGFYAKKYLGLDLTREATMARLDELLALELAAVRR